jgi:hypothetical protein
MCRGWRAVSDRAATHLEAMSDEAPDPPPRLLFGKITPANAHATINRLAIAWSVIVAVQIFEIGAYFGIDQLPCILLLLHLWSVAGVYFVRSRKSRAVAVAQFAYVVLVAYTALFPFFLDGTPLANVLRVLQSIFMAGVAWRGVRATWVHHSAVNLRTDWKRVAAILGFMAIVVSSIYVGTRAGLELIDHDIDALAKRRAVEAVLATFPLAMGLLTWKFPFARRDMAKDVAKIFE